MNYSHPSVSTGIGSCCQYQNLRVLKFQSGPLVFADPHPWIQPTTNSIVLFLLKKENLCTNGPHNSNPCSQGSTVFINIPGWLSVPGGTEVKNSPVNAGEGRDTGLIPGSGRYLEKEMATHSSTLAWKIPWTEEPGALQSMGSQRVRDDWALMYHTYTQVGWIPGCRTGDGGLVVKLYSDLPLYLGWQIENEIEYKVENNAKIKAKRNQSRIHFK